MTPKMVTIPSETPKPFALLIEDANGVIFVLRLLVQSYPIKVGESIPGVIPGCKFKTLIYLKK